MLLSTLLIAWCVWFKCTNSLLSPAVFLALANFQTQKARAVANALNWQARNKYNMAIAKSRNNLPGLRTLTLPSLRNNFAGLSNRLPGLNNNLPGLSNNLPGLSNNLPGLSNNLPGLSNNLPGLKNLNSPSLMNFNLPGLNMNPLLRTRRGTLPDEYFAPSVQEVSLADNDVEEGMDMDMLVPIGQEDESLGISQRTSSGPLAEPTPRLHLHKHHFHHPYEEIHHHIYTLPPTPHFPHPEAFPPPPHLNIHHHPPQFSHPEAFPQSHLDIHHRPLVPTPQFSHAESFPPPSRLDVHHHQPSHNPIATPVQHQDINLNFVQNQRLGAINGVDQQGLDGVDSKGENDGDSQVETEGVDGGNPEEIGTRVGGEGEWDNANRDETLGTFNMFHLDSPDQPPYQDPHHFDPTKPENRQAIVKFIEEEKQSIDNIIRTLNENSYHYNSPRRSFGQYSIHAEEPDYGYESDEEDVGNGKRSDSDRIGSINIGELEQFPTALPRIDQIPTDPTQPAASFDTRQQILADYFSTEQKNVQSAMEELQREHQRNIEILLRNLNGGTNTLPGREENPLGSTNHIENNDNISNDEVLTKLLQNDPSIEHITGISPRVGHIIQVPTRRYSGDFYMRHARSVEMNDTKNLEEFLNAQREILNAIEKDTKHDEDLKMVGQIGKSVIDDIQRRLGKTRDKRATKRKDVASLIADPEERFDMPKTLENIGAVARTSLDDEHAPMYHVRNMMGSARDAVVATMKIPNQNILVPPKYDIVQNGRESFVGDINPSLFSRTGGNGAQSRPIDGVMDTFQKVGSAIRDSVEAGKEALSHVGSAANHAKKAVYSTRYTIPRVISRNNPLLLTQSRQKTTIFTPRIFDFEKDDRLQRVSDNRQDNFVNVGTILDAVGISDPNPNLKFEKITIQPRQSFLDEEQTVAGTQYPPIVFDKIEVEDIDDVEHDPDLVGNTLDNLRQVQNSFGTKSLQDFIVRMKSELRTLVENAKEKTLVGRKMLDDSINRRLSFYNGRIPSLSNRLPLASQKPANEKETLGSSFIPIELTRPFMNQPEEKSMKNNSDRNKANRPIVGAINPMMYERIFKERLDNGKRNEDLQYNFEDQLDESGKEDWPADEDSSVSTSIMKVQGQFLKPFMGQATKKNKLDFYKLYNPSKDDNKEDPDVEPGYDYIELQSVDEDD